MPNLSISAIALAEPGSSLINLIASVCDPDGEPVRGLAANAFSHHEFHASPAAGEWKLDNLALEAFEEFAHGRYRLALYSGTRHIRGRALSISVHRAERQNPVGLPPVYALVAQGHAVISIHETD